MVVSDDNLEAFNNAITDFDGSESAIGGLRGLGDNYMVDGMISLFQDNQGNLSDQSDTPGKYQFVDKNGNTRTDFTAETGGFLEKDGNVICVSHCTFSDGSVDNVSGNTYQANAQSESIVGTIHTHPNSGETTQTRSQRRLQVSGIFRDDGPSPDDKRISPYTKSGTFNAVVDNNNICLLYTSPSPRDRTRSRMPSSA